MLLRFRGYPDEIEWEKIKPWNFFSILFFRMYVQWGVRGSSVSNFLS